MTQKRQNKRTTRRERLGEPKIGYFTVLGNLLGIQCSLPKGWINTCGACPIQYSKIVKIGKERYEGYLRSRWGSTFSISIYEYKGKHGWGNEVWSPESIDTEWDNPPLKSMELIDKQFRKMAKGRKVIVLTRRCLK